MDVLRLGLPYTSEYIPDRLIEGYSSMIWTERFQEPGEFELKTSHIRTTMADLPEGTLISHADTQEVMMVEDRVIDVNADGDPELTVTGRSITHFTEHRHVEAKYGKKRFMARDYRPAGAVAVLLWNAFDNATGKDHSRGDDHPWSDKDRIPNVAIVDSVPGSVGDTRGWLLYEGPLYDQILKILVRGDLGLRSRRPANQNVNVVTVGDGILSVPDEPDITAGGSITREVRANSNALIFEIYTGSDRTSDVVFSVDAGDFEKAQYLKSIRGFKTGLEVMTSIHFGDVYRNPTQQAFTGFQRRMGSLDAGEPEYPDEPEEPKAPKSTASDEVKADYKDAYDEWKELHDAWIPKRNRIRDKFIVDTTDEANRELKNLRRVSLFTGDISPFTDFRYKTDYDLGDTVTLQGEYDQTEQLVVSEYVRTEDAEGDRGYPGLTLP